MNELALFAGAGGGILGGLLLGWTTVGAVEIEPAARNMLLARQMDGILPPFPIWDEVRTFDGTLWRGLVDVVSGGFPCQDISAAGKGAGITGERSGLWKEMCRIICEVRPRFAFMENSPMLTSRGLGTVLGDLAEAGYNAAWLVLGADDVGAPHARKRIWILAADRMGGYTNREHEPQISSFCRGENADTDGICNPVREPTSTPVPHTCGERCDARSVCGERIGEGALVAPDRRGERAGSEGGKMAHSHGIGRHALQPETREPGQTLGTPSELEPSRTSSRAGAFSDTHLSGLEKQRLPESTEPQHEAAQCGHWWSSEPAVGRVAHGVAHRVDRLRALGNGQVPLVAATAFRILFNRLMSAGHV